MTDKLTGAEVKKALECMCGIRNNDIEYQIDCLGCAFDNDGLCHENCSEGIAKATLDLINRLEGENKKNETIIRFADKTIESLKAEVERLNNNISAMAITLSTSARATRHEAYKEFAERLREKTKWLFSSVSINNEIDNLLNELVSDGDGKRKD